MQDEDTTEPMSFEGSTIEDALDEVIRLARVAKAAEIDAGACGTRLDFDKMHVAQDKAADAREAFLRVFARAEAA